MAPYDSAPTATDFPDLEDVTVIARGAHAAVYRAFQPKGRREVVLKIDNRVISPDAAERQRFQQDIRAVGELSPHPGVIDIYSAGLTGAGQPYLVTELCRGSYGDRLASHGALPPEEVQDIGIRICDALAAAHSSRVLHRAIKPANVLINGQGRPVLADFGIESIMDSRLNERVIHPAATLAFAPLEIFQQYPSTESSDIYSLAATLYTLLHGHPPRFPTDGGELSAEQAMALFADTIGDVPGVSRVLLGMLRAAMTNNSEGRPAAVQFKDMLESVPLASATGMIPKIRDDGRETGTYPTVNPQPPAQPTGYYDSPSRPESSPPAGYAEPSPPVGGGYGQPSPPAGYAEPSPPMSRYDDPALAAAESQYMSPPRQSPPADPAGDGLPRRPSPSPRPSPEPQASGAAYEPFAPFGQSPPYREESTGSHYPIDPPPTTNEPTTRRERRLAESGGKKSGMAPLILVGLIAVVIIVAAAVGAFMFLNSDAASAPASETSGGAANSCSMEQFKLSCVSDTCFDGELVDSADLAAAEKVPCGQKHRWEAYAKGELPSEVSDPTYGTVVSVDLVQQTCTSKDESGPLATRAGGLAAAADWAPDVLPPTEEKFEKGERVFMCVAERKGGEPTTERL